jgi:integrase
MLASGQVVVDARVWSVLMGKEVQVTRDTVSAAKAWQSRQRVGRYQGEETDLRKAKQTFAAVAAEWLTSNPAKRHGSLTTDRHRLAGTGVKLNGDGEVIDVKGFAALAVGRITPAEVQRLVDTWKTTHKPSTVRGMFSTLRAVFSYAEKSQTIPKGKSPCENINLPEVPEVERPVLIQDDDDPADFDGVWTLSNDELIRLADAMGPNYSLMVWIGAYLGMRWGEVAGLTVSALNLLKGEIKVMLALDRQRLLDEPKTSAGKRTIVDRDLVDAFATHLAHRGLTAANGDALLFVNAKGRPLIYSSWRLRVWLPALDKAGLAERRGGRYLGFHDLRSVNASIMVAQGVDPKTAQVRFGHARYTTTAGLYARSTPRRNRQASERIHAVLRRSPRDEQRTSAENSG